MENNIDFKEVGKRICSARKKQGLTQEKASEMAFITSQYWCLIESGRNRASICTYKRIADILNITLDDIFYDDATNLRIYKAFSKESMFNDCDDREKAILSETMVLMRDMLRRILQE